MIQVGQVLDKYELQERVGQGGMAIVYRGIDRALKRTVAIKVLHRHLSDYQEARDRFEREAQAVAKLRHENILEIFDYAAKADSESYIVTEFIDGQTLKQFITDRPMVFPEVGAMVMLQVCRALAHAHAAGILHRDVKPENIMIRSDGVVKLMDFGISHMVDLERLTVTGQLLGSPAYMAPEHVEGRPLDFRTDVFAAGIVLYQLAVGKLPFEGKNPHEVLKRIAECKFLDPRQANPRIGNRLGRIILRAMAAMPADRYQAIGEMVAAIEKYLDESGVSPDKVPGELARYFQGPAAYEQALAARLVDALTRRGVVLLDADDRAGALDAFDRVLTIEPQNAKVLAILDGLNRKTRVKHGAAACAAIGVVALCAYSIHHKMQPAPPVDVPIAVEPSEPPSGAQVAIAHVEAPPAADAATALAADAGVAAIAVAPVVRDAAVAAIVAPVIDAPSERVVTIKVNVPKGKGTTIRLGDGGPIAMTSDSIDVPITKPTRVSVHNEHYVDVDQIVTPDQAVWSFPLHMKSATIIASCKPGVAVTVDGIAADLDVGAPVLFDKALDISRTVKVEFIGKRDEIVPVTIEAGETKGVKCAQL